MNENTNNKHSAGLSLEPKVIICPKCQYKRTAADQGPDWQCPSCGIAYSKATAASAAVSPRVNSVRGSGGRNIDRDELPTATPRVLSLSIDGRVGRLRYLAYSWPMMVWTGLGILAAVLPKTPGTVKVLEMLTIPAVVLIVLWFLTMLRLMALRLHDVNLSAKWVLALLLLPGVVTVVGGSKMMPIGTAIFWLVSLLLIIVPGAEDYNDYGPPAGPNTPLVKLGAAVVLGLMMAVAVIANIKYMQYVRSGRLKAALLQGQGATDEHPGSSSVQSPKEKALAALRQSVQEISPTLPRRIDRVTTLTEAEVSGDTYKVSYSMDPTVQLDASRKDMVEQAAKQQICRGATRTLIDNGITVDYLYSFSGSKGEETLFVLVPAGSCS